MRSPLEITQLDGPAMVPSSSTTVQMLASIVPTPGKLSLNNIVRGVALIVRLNGCVTGGAAPASSTTTVKLAAPVAVGVPDSVPVGESVRPAGKVPDDTLQV